MEDVHKHPFHQFAEQLATFVEFSILFLVAFVVNELLLIPLLSVAFAFGGSWQLLNEWPPVVRESAAVCIGVCSVLFIAIGMLFVTSFLYFNSFQEQFKSFSNRPAEYRQKWWRGFLSGGKGR